MKYKKILLCVTGLSPQVVTETLYALAIKSQTKMSRWIPDEIQVLTTEEGAGRVKLALLHEKTGWFHKLLHEYNLPAIKFDAAQIHVLCDHNGHKLQDIRSVQDNRDAADYITEKVRQMTAESETEVHISMAGGRKTMGFFVAYALSLFGRKQDHLSHVLVSPPFESHPEFYYPTRESHVIYLQGDHNKPIDTRKAEITLADIPFVRLHEGLHEQLDTGEISFSRAIELVQSELSSLSLKFYPADRIIMAHDKILKISPSEYAFYWWLAERQRNKLAGVHWTQVGLNTEFLGYYRKLVNDHSGNYEKTRIALDKGIDKEYFEQKKAKVNGWLVKQLGKRIAQPYLITRQQIIPGSHYSRFGLMLEPKQIEIF